MHYHMSVSNENLKSTETKEWLETNELGDYASSTLCFKHTRKYHGLLITNLHQPTQAGRYVLLSSLEDSITFNKNTYELSSRDHPNNIVYPNGIKNIISSSIRDYPQCIFKLGDMQLCREYLLSQKKHMLFVRYTLHGDITSQKYTLHIKPLLSFRNIHTLSKANEICCKKIQPTFNGISITPYKNLPTLFIQTFDHYTFLDSPDWYYHIEYHEERDRGYPCSEDLFTPGDFHIEIKPYVPIIITFSTQCLNETECPSILWNTEVIKRQQNISSDTSILSTLKNASNQFFITTENNHIQVVAGYHWFDSWGRDTCISLPGLAFCTNKIQWGLNAIKTMNTNIYDGMLPNTFGQNPKNHAYNSIDASLWYIWSIQQLMLLVPNQNDWIYNHCWETIKTIIQTYRNPEKSGCHIDETGLVSVGTPNTQLTWMDATIQDVPVTPRFGYPVEINALWYNALAFSGYLAQIYNEPFSTYFEPLATMREAFQKKFLIKGPLCYLGDVWHNEILDTSIRPNQLFALSLPFSILDKQYHADILRTITQILLTPYGLRTLASTDTMYHGKCLGNQEKRDAAYHQGTVWPWLLGAYTDALINTARFPEQALEQLLFFITPLFTKHLEEAGIGTISEIFDGDIPHTPRGCIAQAWSVGECIRLLYLSKQAFPTVFLNWEQSVSSHNISSADCEEIVNIFNIY